ncbi:FKBP-type peptidyl-prolyl cis-trans isomerase [Maricaulis alexandrii]|jgi:FKBP-type peptidyl-prolyl cis-trans isomerase FklB|uniref:FKBP-type peptidyl-prolyl cis-trans isomerase n=1 Tax=Maricaulis alexandrii TaxID=2570354 RepID=UPI001107C9D5|nr:FKBP-type peptidyl-prolyl cis-trans isomerase [Maricaulis alexandrii]
MMKRIALFAAPALVLAACAGTPETPEEILAAARSCNTPDEAVIPTVEGPASSRVGIANTEASEAYLAAVLEERCVYELPSGLIIRIRQSVDDAASPERGDLVTVHYTGQFPNGEVFDSSRTRGEPATFPSDRLIAGWVEALPLMREGERWELYIPGDLAYGSRGTGPIGPNQALVFDLELIDLPGAEDEDEADAGDGAE